MQNQKRSRIEIKLKDYPDVLTVKELAFMLGSSERTTLALLHKGKIKHFRIMNRYQIPKDCVIDFMMTEEYEGFRMRADAARFMKITDPEERKKEKLLFLCETPRGRKELMYLLDIKSKKTFFRVYLKPLLDSGELQMTHPEQPSVSTQKYIRAKPDEN